MPRLSRDWNLVAVHVFVYNTICDADNEALIFFSAEDDNGLAPRCHEWSGDTQLQFFEQEHDIKCGTKPGIGGSVLLWIFEALEFVPELSTLRVNSWVRSIHVVGFFHEVGFFHKTASVGWVDWVTNSVVGYLNLLIFDFPLKIYFTAIPYSTNKV